MVHASNVASRKCFLNAGFTELVSYDDKGRNRRSTVLRVGRPTRVIGIQSGNAVDGVDVCVVDFEEPVLSGADGRDVQGLEYKCLAFKTYAWPGSTRERILKARDGTAACVELAKLNYELGRVFGDVAIQLLDESQIPRESVDLVSSHGQSICGHPHYELGDINTIAQRTGIPTAGDFRTADVAALGHGSPCTCTYDSVMLRPQKGAKAWRTCINIGGTTSMTFSPPQGSGEIPCGLDPGIGVFYMDLNAQAVLGKPYDEDGNLARSGKLSEELLAEMLQHPHYKRTQLPISIGAEDFPRPLFAVWRKKAHSMGLSDGDFQATLVELTTRSLALAASRFGPKGKLSGQDIVVRGGVRFNSFFMERLRHNFSVQLNESDVKFTSMDDLGLDEDSWETVMYAMFGFLCKRGLNNFVPSCTGAKRGVCGGKLCAAGPPPELVKPLMVCTSCGEEVNPTEELAFGCPKKDEMPEKGHVLAQTTCEPELIARICQMPAAGEKLESNPFVRFRTRLFPYRVARAAGLFDETFIEIVKELNVRLQQIEPQTGGFKPTPLKYFEDLKVWAKDESGQVAGSHKSRHFANMMLYLQVLLRAGVPASKGLRDRPLAVASCGNAALAAATIAAAAQWPILVFIPDDAEPSIVSRLRELKADVQICPKAENAKVGGDATVYYCRKAVQERNAIAFSVQASDCGVAAEGSSTLMWEALEQLYEKGVSELGSVLVHVGGGALASGVFSGLQYAENIGILPGLPEFHTVQGEGCAPLAKCYEALRARMPAEGRVSEADAVKLVKEASQRERDVMQVWPDPQGAAHGIQDDETYDWQKVCEGMLRTGGTVHTISDNCILEAWDSARKSTKVNMCHTGVCGYAGVMHLRAKMCPPKEPTFVIFSGLHRES
eukprot:TRINITY_DN18462_c0_g2_i1.p1 TRINITY_DN18462_c0_g2~~TRINITY_DN18462_c0_g2_i1.p1  ORF type:complete len:1048 (-),score=213.49 TRINITY_DN18462_c0_g2_i1:272-2947(-)